MGAGDQRERFVGGQAQRTRQRAALSLPGVGVDQERLGLRQIKACLHEVTRVEQACSPHLDPCGAVPLDLEVRCQVIDASPIREGREHLDASLQGIDAK